MNKYLSCSTIPDRKFSSLCSYHQSLLILGRITPVCMYIPNLYSPLMIKFPIIYLKCCQCRFLFTINKLSILLV